MHFRPIRFVLGAAGLSLVTITAVHTFSSSSETKVRTGHVPDRKRMHRSGSTGRLSTILSEQDNARRSLLWQDWFDTDPATAGAMLLRMSANESGNPQRWHDLMSQLAARWITRDSKAALSWVKSLPEGPGRMKAEVQCAYHWTEADPEEAAKYAFTRENPALHEAVIGKWAELDPHAAANWTVGFAKQHSESEALSRAAAIWAQSDPKAASSFANTLEDPQTRRRVQASIVTSWAMIDPAASFEWAESITDIESREASAERAAEAWIQSDPPAARRRIETSSLPEPVRDRLLAMIAP